MNKISFGRDSSGETAMLFMPKGKGYKPKGLIIEGTQQRSF